MVIEQLRRIQQREGLSDAAFATRLGIHRVSWHRLKHGQVAPTGTRFLMGARRAYPEVGPTIDLFLSGNVTHGKEAVTTDREEMPTLPLKSRAQRPFQGLHRVLGQFRRNWRFFVGL